MKPGDKVKYRVWRAEGVALRNAEVVTLYDNEQYARVRDEGGKLFDLPVKALKSSQR